MAMKQLYEEMEAWNEEKGFGRHAWQWDTDLELYRVNEV